MVVLRSSAPVDHSASACYEQFVVCRNIPIVRAASVMPASNSASASPTRCGQEPIILATRKREGTLMKRILVATYLASAIRLSS